jgi:hypothetical protein
MTLHTTVATHTVRLKILKALPCQQYKRLGGFAEVALNMHQVCGDCIDKHSPEMCRLLADLAVHGDIQSRGGA